MTTPRVLSAYSDAVAAIWQRAVDQGVLILPLPSKNAAHTLRIKLYGYRRAAIANPGLIFHLKEFEIAMVESGDVERDPPIDSTKFPYCLVFQKPSELLADSLAEAGITLD